MRIFVKDEITFRIYSKLMVENIIRARSVLRGHAPQSEVWPPTASLPNEIFGECNWTSGMKIYVNRIAYDTIESHKLVTSIICWF